MGKVVCDEESGTFSCLKGLWKSTKYNRLLLADTVIRSEEFPGGACMSGDDAFSMLSVRQ